MRKSRNTSSYKRKRKYIRPSPFFVIVCEGKVTEVDYFKGFPYYHKLGAVSKSGKKYCHAAVYIEPEAGQHEKVVIKAQEIFNILKKKYGTICTSEVWCVFDCDNDISGLKRAIQAAESKHFNAIYSIQCFELWYLLHFQELYTAINKSEYDRRISRKLKIDYSHSTRGMYDLLKEYQDYAIKVAKQLWEQKKQIGELQGDPITNVHILVEALNDAYIMLNERQ